MDDQTMQELHEILLKLTSDADCDAADNLVKHRRGAILAAAVEQAMQQGFVPRARVEILCFDPKRGKPADKFGRIDGANEKSFTVRLGSGRFDRFKPCDLRLAPESE